MSEWKPHADTPDWFQHFLSQRFLPLEQKLNNIQGSLDNISVTLVNIQDRVEVAIVRASASDRQPTAPVRRIERPT
jgi:hypothetical protein